MEAHVAGGAFCRSAYALPAPNRVHRCQHHYLWMGAGKAQSPMQEETLYAPEYIFPVSILHHRSVVRGFLNPSYPAQVQRLSAPHTDEPFADCVGVIVAEEFADEIHSL